METPSTHQSILDGFRSEADRGQARVRFTARYYGLILAQCRSKRLNQGDAEDLAHEVLLHLYERLEEYENDPNRGKFGHWLTRVVRNKAIDYLRREQKRLEHSQKYFQEVERELASDSDSPLASDLTELYLADMREVVEVVRTRVQGRDWEVFHRTAYLGRPTKEVAAELGVDLALAYQIRSRMKAAILAEFQSRLRPE